MEFEEWLRSAAQGRSPEDRIPPLSRAVELYRGELLPGYYEEWIAPERERFLDQYVGALRRLADALAETADLEGAIACARRAVTADTLREESHPYLMRLYARADRRPELLRQYRELDALLRQELDSPPSSATRKLLDELLSAESPHRINQAGCIIGSYQSGKNSRAYLLTPR
jgi:DNA-binding SARP family transcriptional activator